MANLASLSIRHVVIEPKTVTDGKFVLYPFSSLVCLLFSFLTFDVNNHLNCRGRTSEYYVSFSVTARDNVLSAFPSLLRSLAVIVACTALLIRFPLHHFCCRYQTYTDNLFPLRILRGPGFTISDFESNRIIGQAQFEATRTVMEGSNMTAVSGSVKSAHVYLDM